VPFPAVAAGKRAQAAEWNQVRFGAVAAASSFAPRRLQYPIAAQLWQKYTLNISWLFNVLKSS
jgi:hypothetical protein